MGGHSGAFKRAGLPFPESFRRCHDLRVTAGTNDVMAGMSPAKLQQKLGHTNFRVTQRYVNLAGVVFAEEADALERRLLGSALGGNDAEDLAAVRAEQEDDVPGS